MDHSPKSGCAPSWRLRGGQERGAARRDAQLREFHARGWRPVDLQRVTGYSRETIRQALHPEVRRAANTSRRKAASHRPLPAGRRRARQLRRPQAVRRGGAPRRPARPDGRDGEPAARTSTGPATRATTSTGRPGSPRCTGPSSTKRAPPTIFEPGSTGGCWCELWPTLWLPPQVRRLWESRFPELASLPRRGRLAWTPSTSCWPGSASPPRSGTGSPSPAATRCRPRASCSDPARTSTCSRSGSGGASSRPRSRPSSTPTSPRA